jgi:2-polyprenyl-3-methyl-5-hydroxy-6-metoxy-1,4-benzoquinol methylase
MGLGWWHLIWLGKRMKFRHRYQYRFVPHSAAARIMRMVGRERRVLELGSGPGAITRLLEANGCQVTAVEIDPEAVELVTPYCERVVSANLNDPDWPKALTGAGPFQVIVAGDVLEHLYDPWETLKKLAPLLAPEGEVVLSVPHAGHNALIACLLSGDFGYQPWGLLDKTHIRFFAMNNIQRLATDAGFKIIEAEFVVKNPEQTEFARRWRQLPAETRAALEVNPFGTVYQVVVRMIRRDGPGKGLRLMALPVPPASAEAYSIGARGNRILGYGLSYLSLGTRDRLSRLLQRFGIGR